jgi:hypothetical protein
VAGSWFTDRVQRVERSWHSFVKQQVRGELPHDWDSNRRNVAIFTSSEDEFVSIGESWSNPLYRDQCTAIQKILADVDRLDPRIHFYIRVHPNLRGLENEQLRSLLALSGPRASVIPADAAVDSYALMRESEKIVTFGSSIGIEAVYWGKPSVLLGPCFYRGFPGLYQPSSHGEAIAMLNADLLPPLDRTGALMYGYWFQTHGERFRYFQATGLFEGRFRGQLVFGRRRKPRLLRLVGKIQRKWRSLIGQAALERSP